MTDNGWTSAHLTEVEPLTDLPDDLAAWVPVRHRLGVDAFGVNAWIASDAGQQIIEEHDENNDNPADNHEELYLVTAGHATFTVDGNELDAPAGTLVFVKDPQIVRKAVASEAGTTVLAIGATPGYAFTPSPWEQEYIERSAV